MKHLTQEQIEQSTKEYKGTILYKLIMIKHVLEEQDIPEIEKESKELVKKLNKIIKHSKKTIREGNEKE